MSISQRLRTCAKHTGLDSVIELLQEAADEIDALQARAQVQGEPVTVAVDHFDNGPFEAYTNRIHPPVEIGTKLYTQPQPAQVQGELEPYDAGLLNDFGGGNVEWWRDYIRAELGRAHDFYQSQLAPPQPAQATQAEVTDGIRPEDFTVDVVVKPMGGFAPVNTQGVRVTHKPTGISVTCDAARSQHTNRHQAFEKLRAILALRHERVPMTHKQAIEMNDAAFDKYVTQDARAIELVRSVEAHHRIQAKKEQA